jgi:two-component system OmpR family sensor kinase
MPQRTPSALPGPKTLRFKLTVVVLALLAGITLALGVLTHTLMQNALTRQTDDQLLLAADRASHFRVGTGHDDGGRESLLPTVPKSGLTTPAPSESPAATGDPLDAPGQGPGTLNAVISGGTVTSAQILDQKTGARVSLTADDQVILKDLEPQQGPANVHLSVGDYRVKAVTVSGQTLITGLPLAQMHNALDTLSLIVAGVGGGGLVIAAVAGTLLIRRELRPLERVSRVAQEVAKLPLDAGEVRLAARVAPEDAREGTEAGAVGQALNQLLDSVESALESRQASEMKVRQFVADASHELRNPLAAIRGYSELLGATEHFSEDGYKALGRVQAQSHRMSVLVEGLLLLARLDEGHAPRMTNVDLSTLVMETVNDFRVSAPDHVWRLDMSPEPVGTRGDERQLHQILTNLLSNARKHTAPGTEVTAGVHPCPDGRWAILSITDNGEGIKPDFLPQIFERFSRADTARSGSDGTTGLGLSIVRAIARAHGGEVTVESRPGRTRFEVRLPLAAG